MNIELFGSILAILFVLGFIIGYKKFRVPKCVQKIFVALVSEFAASTEEFTKSKLLNVLESHVETQELLNDKDELVKCIKTIYGLLKKPVKELPDKLDDLKKILVDGVVELFTRRGILAETNKGRYRIYNVLNMLTEKHYVEARSVTRNDAILYGAYQVRHITSLRAVFIEYLPIFLGFILGVIVPRLSYVYPNSVFSNIIERLNPRGAPLPLRSLFVLSLGVLFKDVIDNAVKAYYREKYRVVIGLKSGIRYDLTYDDRLSGNIRRRLIGKSQVDLEQSMIQRMFSRFSSVPVGNIKIRMPAKDAIRAENPGLIDETISTAVDCMKDLGIKSLGETDEEKIKNAKAIIECAKRKSRKAKELSVKDIIEIFEERPRYIIRRFVNMPYPNEMYKAIKTLQLGHIHRRMRNADKILMRKGGAVASVNTKRRR